MCVCVCNDVGEMFIHIHDNLNTNYTDEARVTAKVYSAIYLSIYIYIYICIIVSILRYIQTYICLYVCMYMNKLRAMVYLEKLLNSLVSREYIWYNWTLLFTTIDHRFRTQ